MELIGKQIAIETILGQPPELHYPSWYAAQIEKLPPAPLEYLAEQAGILATDTDTISRQAAIDALGDMPEGDDDFDTGCRQQWNWDTEAIKALPPAQPEPYTDALKAEIKRMKRSFTICINSDYYTGYMSALSAVEGYIDRWR